MPITQILGPVGTGKSSPLEAAWYVLGQPAVHMPAVRSHVEAVRLVVVFGTRRLRLTRRRARGSGTVLVEDLASGEKLTLPVAAHGEATLLSDYLLSALDIPSVALPEHGADGAERLTLGHLWPLLHLRRDPPSRSGSSWPP